MSDTSNYYAVILAGGKGERFWPLSTSRTPKQLLSLVGNEPLLAQAVTRLRGLIPPERIFIITNADLAEAVCRIVPHIPAEQVIGEPIGRDTAAAIALGAVLVARKNPTGVFCVLTADHIIGDIPLFQQTLRAGLDLAGRKPMLVTIGIAPRAPSTAYGYIESGDPLDEKGEIEFRRAKRFVEKPDRATAESYLASGLYAWNSGMFMWSKACFHDTLRKHRPALAEMMDRLLVAGDTKEFSTVVEREYAQLEKISIDYALMEKADNVVMCRGMFAWDDVGSWPALDNHLPRNADGNAIQGDCVALDAAHNIVVSHDRLTALIGVRDLVVVQAEGVTLVCPKSRAQDVRKMVEQLRADGRYGKAL